MKQMIAGICGIAAAVFVVASIVFATTLYKDYSIFENTLSDLGAGENSSIVFNSSMIILSVMVIIFALGLYAQFRSQKFPQIGAFLFIIAGIDIVLIRIFPVDVPIIHTATSAAFGVFASLSLIFIWLGKKEDKLLMILGFGSFISISVIGLVFWGKINAAFEILMGFWFLVFAVVYGAKMTIE